MIITIVQLFVTVQDILTPISFVIEEIYRLLLFIKLLIIKIMLALLEKCIETLRMFPEKQTLIMS